MLLKDLILEVHTAAQERGLYLHRWETGSRYNGHCRTVRLALSTHGVRAHRRADQTGLLASVEFNGSEYRTVTDNSAAGRAYREILEAMP